MSDFDNMEILDLSNGNRNILKFVTIEITESELMACNSRELDIIDDLKRVGLKFSIDDFGTGYPSLRYIHSWLCG